ncbi:MAG TPA: hypothetical protein VFT75_18245 [Nocardioidaceae bacterium]|nr:hypothetical protein [Nocardioidaceae bacterium]
MSSPSAGPFGPIISGKQVEAATRATIQLWFPTYLAEAAAQSGIGRDKLQLFRSYSSKLTLAKAAEDQMPACVIVAPGTDGAPERHHGKITMQWAVGIGCIVSGQDVDSTYDLARTYVAAVRALMLQQSSLGGFADAVDLVSERYDDLATQQLRTLCAGVVQLSVRVSNITDTMRGPTAPNQTPADPLPDLPTVENVYYDIQEESYT